MLSSILLAAVLMSGVSHALPTLAPKSVIAADLDKGVEKQQEKINEQVLLTKPVVTRHKVVVGRKEINYTATAGQLPIMNDAGVNLL